jgi:hypothetical protein
MAADIMRKADGFSRNGEVSKTELDAFLAGGGRLLITAATCRIKSATV